MNITDAVRAGVQTFPCTFPDSPPGAKVCSFAPAVNKSGTDGRQLEFRRLQWYVDFKRMGECQIRPRQNGEEA